MEFYIKVSFWFTVVVTLIRIFLMAASKWPRELEPESLGMHLARTLLGAAFAIWAGIVLWK